MADIRSIRKLKTILDKIQSKYNCDTAMTIDSTEGIVYTSAGIKHPKEESLNVFVEAKGFNISFSPITKENIEVVYQYLKKKYFIKS